jgi:hypothetical protein
VNAVDFFFLGVAILSLVVLGVILFAVDLRKLP